MYMYSYTCVYMIALDDVHFGLMMITELQPVAHTETVV